MSEIDRGAVGLDPHGICGIMKPGYVADTNGHKNADKPLPPAMAKMWTDFEAMAGYKLKPVTMKNYRSVFNRFVRSSGVKTIKELKGNPGLLLVLNFFKNEIPLFSQRVTMAMLKTVWEISMPTEIPWPMTRRYQKKLPATRRRETPPDAIVKMWNDTVKIMPSLYFKTLWVLIGAHGLRPSQCADLTWRNIIRNDSGMPVRIAASGAENDDKSFSDINAVFSDIEARIIREWAERAISENSEINDKFVVPKSTGIKNDKDIDWTVKQTSDTILDIFHTVQRVYGLPRLTPVGLRHWVAGQLVNLGLSDPAAASYQGHKVKLTDDNGQPLMRAVYNTPSLEKVLAEQRTLLGPGLLALLDGETVRTAEFTDVELNMLRDLKTGKLDMFRFAMEWPNRPMQPRAIPMTAENLLKP